MKTLHYSMIAILLVTNIFGIQHVFAQNITNSSNVISPIQSSILHSPVPTLSPPENQSIVNVALAIPKLQNWSHDWKYIDTSFLGNNKIGIAGGFEWQYAIVTLKASSSSAPIPCDNDWWAWIEIDMTTMKVVQATYPTMDSHQCEVAMGGGSVSSHVIVPVVKSPLKQFKSGIAAKDVKCKEGLKFIMKNENGQPACVTPHTFDELITRGWGIIPLGGLPTYDNTSISDTGIHPFSIDVTNTNFTLNYNVSGNNKLLDANMDSHTESLVLSMYASSNGTLSISIPRALLDSKSPYDNQDTKFIILIDKQEVKYTETTSITARTLTIPFELGAKKIEITAPVNI